MKRCALKRGPSVVLAACVALIVVPASAGLGRGGGGRSLRPTPRPACGRPARARPDLGFAIPLAEACAADTGNPAVPPAIRVDRESFWYEEGPRCAELERYSLPCAPRGTAARVARAVEEVVRFHPDEFSTPPPYETIVRARPREAFPGGFQTVTDLLSYGGADLVGHIAFVDVNLTAFIGETPLNDAELRSFLAHELKHAYQFANGAPPRNSPELWRREVEAHEWELAHMEPGTRSWYRAEALFNLEMYRRLLKGE